MTADPGYPAMTRKQEVVEILKELSHLSYDLYFDEGSDRDYLSIEDYYDRLAPLMQGDITWADEYGKDRMKITIKDGDEVVYTHSCPHLRGEFPEDWEMRSSCPRCHSEVILNKDGIVFKYECGPNDRGIDRRNPRPTEGDNILEQEVGMTSAGRSDKEIYDGPPTKRRFSFDEAKEKLSKRGICQKCGGSGRVPQSEKSKEEGFVTANITDDYDCPQCDGTGKERRKGKERDYNLRLRNPSEKIYIFEGDVGIQLQIGYDCRTQTKRKVER